MTVKQQRFVDIITRTALTEEYPTGDTVSAYIQAYGAKPTDTEQSIKNKACQQRRRLMENKEVREILEAYGLGIERVAVELHRGLRAMKTLTYQGKIARDENGIQIDLVDNTIRLKILELLTSVQGLQQKHNAGNIMVQDNRLIVFVHDEDAPPLTEEQTKYKKEAEKRIYNARNYISEEENNGDGERDTTR